MPNGAIFMQQVVTATRMGETEFSQNLRGRVWQKNFWYFQTLDQRDSTSWTKVVSLEFSFLPFHKTKHYSLAVHICIHRSWMLQNFKGLKWKSASFQDSDKLLLWQAAVSLDWLRTDCLVKVKEKYGLTCRSVKQNYPVTVKKETSWWKPDSLRVDCNAP